MVDLALYSKGRVKASHSNLTTTKASHLECTVIFTYVKKMFTITTYLHPHRDAAGILEVAGMHLIEHCLLNNKVIQFPWEINGTTI